jgi:hypothetical protein
MHWDAGDDNIIGSDRIALPTPGLSANLTLQDYGRFTRRPKGIVLKAQCEPLIYDLSVEVFHYNYRVHCRGAQHEPGLSHWK